MTKQRKPSKASEILWLSVAVLSLLTAIHKTYYYGLKNSWYFFGFIFIALFMYALKRKFRQENS